MEATVLSKEVEVLQQDITSLSTDVASLQNTQDELLQEIKTLEEEIEQQQTNHKVKEPAIVDIPDIIKHSHFDPSISSYFKEPEEDTDMESHDATDHTTPIQQDLELRENILYENIFRMTGITAFPVNQYSEDELLGIRFDTYSTSTNTFKTPHYMILQKNNIISNSDKEQSLTEEGKIWSVYKHTLPSYVPLLEYNKILDDSNESIIQLSTLVRNFLIKIQYKHDKLDQLLRLTRTQFNLDSDTDAIISNIDRDLSCQRILITFKQPVVRKLILELKLSLDTIEICTFHSNSPDKQTLKFCQSILKDCNINDIIKKFRLVIKTLITHKIIE
ncbi:Central kinetochore subunit MCM21 [Spathaspora sp. JA1]|nr:Central kinetochore subunit MCM21 [Spathaspora sp. JA1]